MNYSGTASREAGGSLLLYGDLGPPESQLIEAVFNAPRKVLLVNHFDLSVQ